MILTWEIFISTIAERKVYLFSTKKISTSTPHYFICLKRTDTDLLIMTCCTSQFDTVRLFAEKRNLPTETLVWITPNDQDNPFDKDTYVNCNQSFVFALDEFKELYESGKFGLSGEISESHYHQILIGLHKSPLIDEDTKTLIPIK